MPSYQFAVVGAQPADGIEALVDAFPGYREQIAALWPELAAMTLRQVPPGQSASSAEIAVTLTDEIDDAAALAYHTKNFWGAVQCVVERPQCAKYRVPLTAALIHEVVEAGINPFLNRKVTVPIGGYGPQTVMQEIADPVTSGIVPVNGVAFSNATGPLFWVPGSPAGSRFDLLGEAAAPLPIVPKGGALEMANGSLLYGDVVPTPERMAYLTEKRGRRWAAKRGMAVVA
jgi:hypothetical protein